MYSGPRKFYGAHLSGAQNSKCLAGVFLIGSSAQNFCDLPGACPHTGCCAGPEGGPYGAGGRGCGELQQAALWGCEAQFYQPQYLIPAIVLEVLQCTGPWGCHHFQQFSFQGLQDTPDFSLTEILPVCEQSIHYSCIGKQSCMASWRAKCINTVMLASFSMSKLLISASLSLKYL